MHYPPEALEGLEAFGLEKKEAFIYLAGLELGTSTVLELSRRTQMPRTTLYPLLEKLRRFGAFKKGKEKKRIVYTAEPPELLRQSMLDRQAQLDKSIPTLEVLQETAMGGPGVTFFEGTEGFKKLWRHIYASGVDEYRLITTGVGLLDYVKEPYLVDRVIAERKRRGIKSKQLIPKNRETKKIVEREKTSFESLGLFQKMLIFHHQLSFLLIKLPSLPPGVRIP